MSPVDSDGDEQPPSSPPNEPILKIYGVYNTGTRIKFRVHAGDYDSPCVYYVNSSNFTPGTPDVELRAGDSQDGSVVAFGTFHSLSGNVTMGIGDPEDESGHAIYVELKKESSLVHLDYVFETDLTASTDGKRVTYTWRRNIGKRLFADYSCLDAATGQLVAYFDRAGRMSREKVGRLCVVASTSTMFDEMLLISWFSIREKENRNAWYVGGFSSGTA